MKGWDRITLNDTLYALQHERVRGEPTYYTVFVYEHGSRQPALELFNERSMGCTAARARRMAEQHSRGITRGMSARAIK